TVTTRSETPHPSGSGATGSPRSLAEPSKGPLALIGLCSAARRGANDIRTIGAARDLGAARGRAGRAGAARLKSPSRLAGARANAGQSGLRRWLSLLAPAKRLPAGRP